MSYIQGLNAPIGIDILDSGVLNRASNKQLRDGSTFNRVANPAKFNAVGLQFGYTATFNASATPIVAMTNYNLPSGNIATASSEYDATYPAWQAFNNTPDIVAISGSGNPLDYWVQRELPAIIPFGFAIGATSISYTGGIRSGYITGWDGSVWTKLKEFEGISYASPAPISLGSPNILKSVTKIKLVSLGNNTFTTWTGCNLSIFPADLSKFKIVNTPFNTGDAITVAPNEGEVLPTGLTEGTVMYARKEDTDNNTFYDTSAHAIAGGVTGLIAITDAGTGTFKVEHADIFRVDTLANSYVAY